jgi:hypothetical protein
MKNAGIRRVPNSCLRIQITMTALDATLCVSLAMGLLKETVYLANQLTFYNAVNAYIPVQRDFILKWMMENVYHAQCSEIAYIAINSLVIIVK